MPNKIRLTIPLLGQHLAPNVKPDSNSTELELDERVLTFDDRVSNEWAKPPADICKKPSGLYYVFSIQIISSGFIQHKHYSTVGIEDLRSRLLPEVSRLDVERPELRLIYAKDRTLMVCTFPSFIYFSIHSELTLNSWHHMSEAIKNEATSLSHKMQRIISPIKINYFGPVRAYFFNNPKAIASQTVSTQEIVSQIFQPATSAQMPQSSAHQYIQIGYPLCPSRQQVTRPDRLEDSTIALHSSQSLTVSARWRQFLYPISSGDSSQPTHMPAVAHRVPQKP